MSAIIECIPNFSEGKDKETLFLIASVIKETKGVQLLHQDSGIAANRTVFTFAGEVHSVFEAAYKAILIASERIDMRSHKGEHPRIGACDVCPFVPISGIKMSELLPLVESFAKKVADHLSIPIFLYEESAKNQARKNLAKHRIGNYEALQSRIENKRWLPDFGEVFNAKTGGIVMGARNFLVAYNINLNTKDAKIAQEIAYDLRELGRPQKNENGTISYLPGKLKNVKAIGWYIKDFDKAQVSINLTDYKTTSLFTVFESCKEIAKSYQVEVSGSELIGLIPLEAILDTGKKYNLDKSATEEQLIQSSIKGLGLDELSPFLPNKRILEYVMKSKH